MTLTPQRLLIVRNDRIGDMILTLPLLDAVRRAWPGVHLTVLVSRTACPLLAGSRVIDELLVDDEADSPHALGARLRRLQFDTALVVNTNTRNAWAVWRAGIRQRVMSGYKAAGFLLGNRRVMLHRSHPPVHEAEFALAFARRIGASAQLDQLSPRLEIDSGVHERVAARIARDLPASGEPLFAVHPGNRGSAYNWSAARYAELVDRLSEHGRVMVTGSPDEDALLREVRSQMREATWDRVVFYSDFALLETAAALSQATAMTVSSTGPMHIAGVLGTPVVGLFSPHPAHAPPKWAPLGKHHTLLVAPLQPGESPDVPRERGTEVMERIRIETVLAANLHYAQQQSIRQGKLTGERAA